MNPETPCGRCGHTLNDHLEFTCFPGWVSVATCFVGWVSVADEFLPGPDSCECVGFQDPL